MTAAEATEQSNKIKNEKDDEQYALIQRRIEEAVNNGSKSIIFSEFIRWDVKQRLIADGFIVDCLAVYRGCSINWP